MKINEFISLVVMLVWTAAACASESFVCLAEADNGRTNFINVGREVEIALKGNPTTGYSWEVVSFSTNIIKQIGMVQYLPDNSSAAGGIPRVGAGGKFTFRFKALGAGHAQIKLIYRRPWETTVHDRVYSVVLDIK